MSKRYLVSKRIHKGKFYHFHDGSKTGHPGMVYWKSDRKNLYLAVTTDSEDGTHRTPLKYPIEKGVKKSFVKNRPLLAKRKNVGSEYKTLKFHKDDKAIIKIVSRRDFRDTPDIRRKDRRFIKKLFKKPRY